MADKTLDGNPAGTALTGAEILAMIQSNGDVSKPINEIRDLIDTFINNIKRFDTDHTVDGTDRLLWCTPNAPMTVTFPADATIPVGRRVRVYNGNGIATVTLAGRPPPVDPPSGLIGGTFTVEQLGTYVDVVKVDSDTNTWEVQTSKLNDGAHAKILEVEQLLLIDNQMGVNTTPSGDPNTPPVWLQGVLGGQDNEYLLRFISIDTLWSWDITTHPTLKDLQFERVGPAGKVNILANLQAQSCTFNSVALSSGITTNTVDEYTADAGVTVDDVLLKDSNIEALKVTAKQENGTGILDLVGNGDGLTTGAVGRVNITASGGGPAGGAFIFLTALNSISFDTDIVDMTTPTVLMGIALTNTINERTTNAGVTVDGMLIKDGTVKRNFVDLYSNAAQSISSDNNTPVAFNSTYEDTAGYHSNTVNNSRVTNTSNVNKTWLVIGKLQRTDAGTDGWLGWIAKNGDFTSAARRYGCEARVGTGSATQNAITFSAVIRMAPTDYIELGAYITGGGTLGSTFADRRNELKVYELE